MPRPPEITQEDIDRWDSYLLEYEKSNPPVSGSTTALEELTGFHPPDPMEVWYSGSWLDEKLKEAGANKQEVDEVNFSSGQKTLFSKDAWQTAQESLDDFHRGEWDKPGPELAKRLNDEFLPAIMAGMNNRT